MRRFKTFDNIAPGLVLRLAKRFNTHVSVVRARRSLGALDDHLLRDLGIARAEIDHVIRSGRRP
jgi:uncharacterized protein YjiS (DUF1127 family)